MITQSVIKKKTTVSKVLKRNQKQANREFRVTERGTYTEYKHIYTTHLRVLSSLQADHLNSIYETVPSAHGGQRAVFRTAMSCGNEREKSQAKWENSGESLQHWHRNGFPSWENIRVGSSSCFVSSSNVKMIAMFLTPVPQQKCQELFTKGEVKFRVCILSNFSGLVNTLGTHWKPKNSMKTQKYFF